MEENNFILHLDNFRVTKIAPLPLPGDLKYTVSGQTSPCKVWQQHSNILAIISAVAR